MENSKIMLSQYYSNFTSEEVEQLDRHTRDLLKSIGINECLLEAEKLLGVTNSFTIHLRKKFNSFESERFFISDQLRDKVISLCNF